MKEYSKTERLWNIIKETMLVKIGRITVEQSFPPHIRPTLEEMEIAICAGLGGEPISAETEMKLETKPTKEMLDEFCEKYGLEYLIDYKQDCYIFKLKKERRGKSAKLKTKNDSYPFLPSDESPYP